MKVHFFTCCTAAQLPHALLMADSGVRAMPQAECTIFLASEVSTPLTVPAQVQVKPLSAWFTPMLASLSQRYTTTELINASIPWCALQLINEYPSTEALVYCSPTIRFFDEMPLSQLLGTNYDLVVFPFFKAPMAAASLEHQYLNRGVVSDACWIVWNSHSGRDFLEWLWQRLSNQGQIDYCQGLGSIRLWLMHASSYFTHVHYCRSNRFSLAWGHLNTLSVVPQADKWLISDSETLCFANLETGTVPRLSANTKRLLGIYRKELAHKTAQIPPLQSISVGLPDAAILPQWKQTLIKQTKSILKAIDTFKV